MIRLRNVCYVLVFTLLCCKKPYNPPPTSTNNSYLVVEGVINLSVDSTVIKLSRTVKINDSVAYKPVLGATVSVEGEKEFDSRLDDIHNNGHYFTYAINLPTTQRYRLKIVTQEGTTYLSDYVEAKPTPPIDSIGYTITNDILNLYVNTHDPANKTHYYRWDYEETWAFHAKYPSIYVLDPVANSIVARRSDQMIYNCFGNDVSSNILLTSTEKLSKDVVYQGPLTQIPLTSEKIEKVYSVLLRQYAVTQDAFNFYQNIKKNTEQLGSIFDAQPSQISGNIHNVKDPKEPVVGYVSMTNVRAKRIFIQQADFPENVRPKYPYDCEEDSALYFNKQHFNDVQNILINPPVTYIPTDAIRDPFGGIIGFKYSTRECLDCTLRGTTMKPYYWPFP